MASTSGAIVGTTDVPTTVRPREAAAQTKINGPLVTMTAATVSGAAWYIAWAVNARQAVLFGIGVSAGVILYHSAFGFTSSWRAFAVHGRGAGVRAQMLMLALTCAVFFPALSRGSMFGRAVHASTAPAGVSVVVGAFLFGVGMQLAGGCASGSLYSLGGGNARMLLVLAAFVTGSLAGTAHMPWWSATPAVRSTSLIELFGPMPAFAISVIGFGSIVALTVVVERRAHPGPNRDAATYALVRGPWPIVAGAVGLSVVNLGTLFVSGRPWGVTSAFALWGAKAAQAIGVRPRHRRRRSPFLSFRTPRR